jgi:hypothetical protein
MTHDEEAYPEATSFKPERFIKNGALNKEVRDPRDIIFGFGRRYIFFRFQSIVCQVSSYFSCDASEFVLVNTSLSAPSGCQLLQF